MRPWMSNISNRYRKIHSGIDMPSESRLFEKFSSLWERRAVISFLPSESLHALVVVELSGKRNLNAYLFYFSFRRASSYNYTLRK